MSDLFNNDNSTTHPETPARADIKAYDPKYIEVKLSSAGKLLGVPAILHVRNYNGKELTKLSMMTDRNRIPVILNVIGQIIQEDIDVSLLHLEDVKEILLNVYINFWDQRLENYEYKVSEQDVDPRSLYTR